MDYRQALSVLLSGADEHALAKDAAQISEAYRTRTGQGKRLVTREREAAAYAAARMPATLAAAKTALFMALDATQLSPATMLDCGAGTGAVSWAANELLSLTALTCLEREDAMRAVGQQLMQLSEEPALTAAVWQSWDATDPAPLPKCSLVCEGYMLGELAEKMRLPVARRLWDACEEMLLFIEPGTPQGFANLRAVRKMLTSEGAYVAAPCPQGSDQCPMAGNDWCHFTVRVQRNRLQKTLKGGDAPYEDEKFAYLALTRKPPANTCTARVLRHPQIAPGRITLTLCEAGRISQRSVTRKDTLWKTARKLGAGDAI